MRYSTAMVLKLAFEISFLLNHHRRVESIVIRFHFITLTYSSMVISFKLARYHFFLSFVACASAFHFNWISRKNDNRCCVLSKWLLSLVDQCAARVEFLLCFSSVKQTRRWRWSRVESLKYFFLSLIVSIARWLVYFLLSFHACTQSGNSFANFKFLYELFSCFVIRNWKYLEIYWRKNYETFWSWFEHL